MSGCYRVIVADLEAHEGTFANNSQLKKMKEKKSLNSSFKIVVIDPIKHTMANKKTGRLSNSSYKMAIFNYS